MERRREHVGLVRAKGHFWPPVAGRGWFTPAAHRLAEGVFVHEFASHSYT